MRKNKMPLMSSYHPKPVEIQVENKAEESYRPGWVEVHILTQWAHSAYPNNVVKP